MTNFHWSDAIEKFSWHCCFFSTLWSVLHRAPKEDFTFLIYSIVTLPDIPCSSPYCLKLLPYHGYMVTHNVFYINWQIVYIVSRYYIVSSEKQYIYLLFINKIWIREIIFFCENISIVMPYYTNLYLYQP